LKARLAILALFSIAFAYVESAVVVYLRALYYPQGFSLPLAVMSRSHMFVEIGREAMTMVMLCSAAFLCTEKGNRKRQMISFFIFAFGVWDIFYYVWLKALLNWPESFLTPDILFLIPVVWVGPVVSPVLVSCAMTGAALYWLNRDDPDKRFPGLRDYAGVAACCVPILWTYLHKTMDYNWPLFLAAYAAGLLIIFRPFISGIFRKNGKA
jgi:hypothetical protein